MRSPTPHELAKVELRKDDTISGRQVGDVSKDIGESGFKQKLGRIAQVLENRLTRLDDWRGARLFAGQAVRQRILIPGV
jgi:hypothetical protein